MKTTEETIQRPVYVFAEAKTEYQLDNLEPGELPYDYKVKSFDYGDEGSVRIMEQEILIKIPAGIDITMECIRNLEEKIVAVEKKADEEVANLRKRIKALALIEYKPDTTESNGFHNGDL